MKWTPARIDGHQAEPIEAKRFKHWIGTQEWTFCVHANLNRMPGQLTVSDWASGYFVRHIAPTTLAACKGKPLDAARLTLNQLVEQVGEGRVLEVLRSAPKREATA